MVPQLEDATCALLWTALHSEEARERAGIASRAITMGWDAHLPQAVLLLGIDEQHPNRATCDDDERRLASIVRATVGPDTIFCSDPDGYMTLLTPTTAPSGPPCRALHAAVSAAHPYSAVTVAAGSTKQGVEYIRYSYAEAIETMTLGRRLYSRHFVLSYTELGMHRLFTQVPDTALRTLVDETLGPLLAHDNATGELLHTLEIYLHHDRVGVTTSRALCVHYNTLRDRVARIERLIGKIERHPTSRQ